MSVAEEQLTLQNSEQNAQGLCIIVHNMAFADRLRKVSDCRIFFVQ